MLNVPLGSGVRLVRGADVAVRACLEVPAEVVVCELNNGRSSWSFRSVINFAAFEDRTNSRNGVDWIAEADGYGCEELAVSNTVSYGDASSGLQTEKVVEAWVNRSDAR